MNFESKIPVKHRTSEDFDYAAYIANHQANVKLAWERFCAQNRELFVVYDDMSFHAINALIQEHDESKWGVEFVICWAPMVAYLEKLGIIKRAEQGKRSL
jgi:hypothetical protein